MAVLNVSACLVTRGDVDMEPVLASLPFDDIVVWDNSKRGDLAVYGRYAAIEEAKHDWIYVQDDDCVMPLSSLDELIRVVRNHDSGGEPFIVCNMPDRFRHDFYRDHALVGFGAVFHRDAPERAFVRFENVHRAKAHSDFFDRTADVVFTSLTPRVLVDLPYSDLPWAHADNRMWKQPTHVSERQRMLELCLEIDDSPVVPQPLEDDVKRYEEEVGHPPNELPEDHPYRWQWEYRGTKEEREPPPEQPALFEDAT